MKQNITVSLDKELIQKLRVIAATRSTSISRMLSDELRQIVTRTEHYERAKRQALTALERGFHLGGQPASRDELHER
jgi:predicted transcriptional regulator